jgi:ankyrin repeat protein
MPLPSRDSNGADAAKRTILIAAIMATASYAATNGNAPLAEAVKNRDTAQISSLLAQKADPNISEADGTTALHWAVRQDDAPLVDRLLRAGAKANIANRYGIAPLYLACLNADAQIIERLLKAGADVNAPSVEGETPLMTVARAGNVEAAKILLAHGADIYARETWHRQTALMYAAGESHPEMMRLLIAHGALVNDQDGVQKWERQTTSEPREKWLPTGAMTPLLFASRQGCVECAKVLAENGAELNATDRDDVTPMIMAIINGHYDVAAYLLEQGARPNLADKTGRTALYAAVDFHTMPQDNRPSPKDIDNKVSSFELIQMLIAKGADVNAQLKTQQPYRAKLDRGDDTVLTTGTTPMLRAAKAADVPVVTLLLQKGADPKLVTRNGVNPLMAAAGVGTREEDNTGRKKTEPETIETIKLLLAAGVDINAVDSRGQSALHGAAFWGKDQVVEFLAKNGAKLDLKDKKGFTPLDSALGVAGGVGFDQASSTPRPSTVELLKKLASSN